MKLCAKFALEVIGDGSNTSITFVFARVPIEFISPTGNGSYIDTVLSVGLNPTGVGNDLAASSGGSPSATPSMTISGDGTSATLTWGAAVSNGAIVTVTGSLIFD
jgi:hypothetical protein